MANRPEFRMIFGMYDVTPGFYGVRRHFGEIVGVVHPGYVFGIPFIDEIALVPEIPGILSDLEQKVRTSDSRSVDIRSDTTLAITRPATFMRTSPDDYLEKLVPSVQQAVQQTIGSGYTARDVVEKNEVVSTAIKDQLAQALSLLGWGIGVRLFRYTSTTDPADLIAGDAQKLRVAELADAQAKREVVLVDADAQAQVDFIAQKYQIEAQVLALRQQGAALADIQRQVGFAEADVAGKRLDIYANFVSNAITTISSANPNLQPQERELIIISALAPVGQMLSGSSPGAAGMDAIRDALISRTTQRLQGQGVAGYIQGVASAGVNPNVALAAKVIPGMLGSGKKT